MLEPSTMMRTVINALMSHIKERFKHRAETHRCGHARHWLVVRRVDDSAKCVNIKRPLA